MKTVKEAIDAKLKLQQDILNLIQAYESEFDLTVGSVELVKSRTIGSLLASTAMVDISVEV